MQMKIEVSSRDVYNLLYTDNKNYIAHVPELLKELGATRILCVSNGTDVLVGSGEFTQSVSIGIERVVAQTPEARNIFILESDYTEFSYHKHKFGAHLPQAKEAPRREYVQLDNNHLEQVANFDLIVGKSCVCCCEGTSKTCGGIDTSIEGQKIYLKSLITKQPMMVVLSGNKAYFDPEEGTSPTPAQKLYLRTKENAIKACQELNEATDHNYMFHLVEMDYLHTIRFTFEQNENGYIIIAVDKNLIDFNEKIISLKDAYTERHERLQLTEKSEITTGIGIDEEDFKTMDMQIQLPLPGPGFFNKAIMGTKTLSNEQSEEDTVPVYS